MKREKGSPRHRNNKWLLFCWTSVFLGSCWSGLQEQVQERHISWRSARDWMDMMSVEIDSEILYITYCILIYLPFIFPAKEVNIWFRTMRKTFGWLIKRKHALEQPSWPWGNSGSTFPSLETILLSGQLWVSWAGYHPLQHHELRQPPSKWRGPWGCWREGDTWKPPISPRLCKGGRCYCRANARDQAHFRWH